MKLTDRGHDAELVDAKAVGLPMLDKMYKEYPKGSVPKTMQELAEKIVAAHGFIFVTGEYNWGVQPGLKSNSTWHSILSEMGMAVISSTITMGQISAALTADSQITGASGQALEKAVDRFAQDLASSQKARRAPPSLVQLTFISLI